MKILYTRVKIPDFNRPISYNAVSRIETALYEIGETVRVMKFARFFLVFDVWCMRCVRRETCNFPSENDDPRRSERALKTGRKRLQSHGNYPYRLGPPPPRF